MELPPLASPPREVLLGHSSALWQHLRRLPGMAERFSHTLGHRDLATFAFSPNDRVWVFSYSRLPQENSDLITRLQQAEVREVVYLSSSSVIVKRRTTCWEYPRVKAQAQTRVRALPNGRVLTVGLMHGHEEELPAGPQMATSHAELAAFMQAPHWPHDNGRACHLMRCVQRPFRHRLEALAHRSYGVLQRLCGPWPCLLRPLDLLLRIAHMRWYGYT